MRRLALLLTVAGLGALSMAVALALGAGSAGSVLRLNASDYSLDRLDPTLEYDFVTWRLEAMTCLRLMSYADRNGPAGSKLIPEASFPPRISKDGRTYSFTVRPGQRFADGTTIGADSFARTIERALSPKQASPAASFLHDLVGAQAVLDGKRTRPSGMTVKGSTITFRLTTPAADFLNRIAMPFFCAVPASTPIDPQGVKTVPGSGPYTVTSLDPGRLTVLQRNPYYRGPRPQRWDAVRVVSGIDPNASLLQVRKGEADLDLGGLPPTSHAGLGKQYGVNERRYFVSVIPTIGYLALNTSRPFFSVRANRQAVAFAVDRTAMTRLGGAYAGKPNDQILAPGIPGYRDITIYPNRPNVARAKALLAGRTGNVVVYTSNDPVGRATAQVLKANLKAIGIETTVKEFEFTVLYSKAGTRGEPFDVMVIGWFADYLDPFDFINVLLYGKTIGPKNNVNFAYWNDPVFNRRMEQAARLFGDARAAAYAKLDADITREAPIVVTNNQTTREFVSATIGCPMRSAPAGGLNLVMLCRRGG